MPDYLGKAERNTVHLQSSFFCLLGKLTSLRETFEVSTKANSPTRRKPPSSTESSASENKSKKWKLWGKATCKKWIKSAQTAIYIKERKGLQWDFDAKEMVTTTWVNKQYIKELSGLPWRLSGKESACNAGDEGSISGLRKSPEEGYSNPLQYSYWKISWTEEPGGLQSIGSQRVRRDWSNWTQHTQSYQWEEIRILIAPKIQTAVWWGSAPKVSQRKNSRCQWSE